jgi:hypothetical protein
MTDASMPMPAALDLMPMPRYGNFLFQMVSTCLPCVEEGRGSQHPLGEGGGSCPVFFMYYCIAFVVCLLKNFLLPAVVVSIAVEVAL